MAQQEKNSSGKQQPKSVYISVGAMPPQALPLVGKTIQEVRSELGKSMQISDESVAIVDGAVIDKQFESTFKLPAGANLEFVKQAGKKG